MKLDERKQRELLIVLVNQVPIRSGCVLACASSRHVPCLGWTLHFTCMRAESARLSLMVVVVDGGLLANSPASIVHLNDGCALKCRQCACMVSVGGESCGERLRELHLNCCWRFYCLGIVSVYKVTTSLTRLETRIAEFSVYASH